MRNFKKGLSLFRGFQQLRFKTTFHLHLKASKNKWYKKWHDYKFSHHIHVATAVFAFGIMAFSAILNLVPSKEMLLAANGSSSQTTFTGADGTYTNSTPINSGADVALNPVLSNAGGSGWQYKRPITVTNGSGGTLTDYQVQVNPFTDSNFVNNTGLVGSWHMNENSGTSTADLSGNSNTGTLSAANWTTGKFGSAFNADGTNYVSVPNSTVLKPANISVELWFYATSDQNGKLILSKYSATPADYELGVDSNDKLFFRSDSATTSYYATDTATTFATSYLNSWHHIVGTFDTDNILRLYVDGSLKGSSAAFTRANSRTDALNIGRRPYTGAEAPFTGKIDEARIYSRALTPTEISNRYGTAGVPKVRGDYVDLRFTNAVTGVEYPYWQEIDGRYWVKINSLPNGTNTNFLNMYYGNAAAVSSSSYDNAANTTTSYSYNGDANLEREFRFNETAGQTTGTVADTSANASTGTLTNMNSPNGVISGGRLGNGISTDGANDYIECGDVNGSEGANGTFEAWVNPTALNGQDVIISKSYASGTIARWIKVPQFDLYDGSWYTAYSGGASTGAWTHFVGTWGSAGLKMYKNGRLVGTNSYTGSGYSSAYSLAIGEWKEQLAGAYGYNGAIDEIRVYSRAIPATDVAAHYLGRRYVATEPTHSAPGTEATAYNTSGSYTTAAQAPTGVYNWGALTFTKTTPGTSTATVDVLNGTTSAVISSNVASGTNLNLSGVTYPSLKIKVNYTTSDISLNPYLSDWNLAYSFDITAPTVPTGLTVGSVTSSSVPLSWTTSTDTESSDGLSGRPVPTYEVQRAPDSAGLPGTWAAAGGSCAGIVTATNCADSSLSANTKYYFRIRAKDAVSNTSGYSGERNVDANTVGLWHLNEGTGTTTADSSGNGNTGTINGTSYWGTSGANRRLGEAAFSGSGDDYVNTGNGSSLRNFHTGASGVLTLEAIIKTSAIGAKQIIANRYDNVNDKREYELYINTAGNLEMAVSDLTSAQFLSVKGSTTLSAGQYYYVTAVFSAAASGGTNKIKFYVNGNPETGSIVTDTGTFVYMTDSDTFFAIGARSALTGYFTGIIDEVRISNTARSAADILAYYNESNPQPKSATTLTATPTLSAPATPQKVAKPTITGTGATPSTTVRLYDNGTQKALLTADGSGNFIFNASTPGYTDLTEGEHTNITVRGYNDGGETPDSTAVTVFVDTVVPLAPTTRDAAKVNDAGGNNIDDAAYNGNNNTATIYFAWSGATDPLPSSNIKRYWVYFGPLAGGVPRTDGQATADATASAIKTLSSPVSGTDYYLRLQTEDNAGNISSDGAIPTLFVYRFDNTAPSNPTTVVPSPAGWSETNAFDFSWTNWTEADSGIDHYLYSRKETSGGEAYEALDPINRKVDDNVNPINLVGAEALYSGTNWVRIYAVDAAGNISSTYGLAPTSSQGLSLVLMVWLLFRPLTPKTHLPLTLLNQLLLPQLDTTVVLLLHYLPKTPPLLILVIHQLR